MGELRVPVLAKLFIGMISSDSVLFDSMIEKLCLLYGPVDRISDDVAFDRTEYYYDEMGRTLLKRFVSFDQLIDQDAIIEIKHTTNALEQNELNEQKGRLINLDPGYVTAAKVMLATTKDYSHRLYLGRQIFGEITLSFKGGHALGHPWTYPDYLKKEYTDFFEKVRVHYMRQIKNH